MATLFIPTEEDIKQWVKDAINEVLKGALRGHEKPAEEPLLTRKEVAKLLGISLVTLTDWVKRGLPVHKNRGRVYFLRSEVMGFLNVRRA